MYCTYCTYSVYRASCKQKEIVDPVSSAQFVLTLRRINEQTCRLKLVPHLDKKAPDFEQPVKCSSVLVDVNYERFLLLIYSDSTPNTRFILSL